MYPGWSARDNYAVHKKRRKRKIKQGGGAGAADGKAESSDDTRECVSVLVCIFIRHVYSMLLWSS